MGLIIPSSVVIIGYNVLYLKVLTIVHGFLKIENTMITSYNWPLRGAILMT